MDNKSIIEELRNDMQLPATITDENVLKIKEHYTYMNRVLGMSWSQYVKSVRDLFRIFPRSSENNI